MVLKNLFMFFTVCKRSATLVESAQEAESPKAACSPNVFSLDLLGDSDTHTRIYIYTHTCKEYQS